jgi:hypothetical protein
MTKRPLELLCTCIPDGWRQHARRMRGGRSPPRRGADCGPRTADVRRAGVTDTTPEKDITGGSKPPFTGGF